MKRQLTDVNATYRLPQPGELSERLAFRTRQDVPAEGGGTLPVYTDNFECWGKVRQLSGTAWRDSMQTDEKITHTVIIRKRSGINTDMEIVTGGVVYRVIRAGPLNDGRRFTRIDAKALHTEEMDNPPPGGSTFYGGYHGNAG
ncbi:phage head closure protein [Salmonella enterica]|nr:phage head closure protein [Salmonella enterica]